MKTRSEQFASLALAVLLAIGAGVAWGLLFAWGSAVVSQIAASDNVHEQLLFLRDGTPIIQSFIGNNYDRRTFRTLDGKDVEVAHDSCAYGTYLVGPDYPKGRFTDLPWRLRVLCVHYDQYGAESWFFVRDGKLDGHGYFVCYDRAAKARVGCIGLGGFQTDVPPLDQQFPINGRTMHRGCMINWNRPGTDAARDFLTDDGLMEINFKKRSVAVVWKGADLISAAVLEPSLPSEGMIAKDAKFGPTLLLRTPDRVVALSPDGKEIKNYRLPPDLRENSFQWLALPNGETLVYQFVFGCPELFWFDAGGKVVRHQHIDLVNQGLSQFAKNTMLTATVPSPGVVAGLIVCYPWAPAECPNYWTYSDALRQAFGRIWPVVLVTGIISLVLAFVCYRRQRAYGLPWTWLWTIFVLLFGLPAFFGYLAHCAWPARLPCPHCGQRVPRDRPACFACGREFPAPAAKGIEVFA
jgi:hypothetical protein